VGSRRDFSNCSPIAFFTRTRSTNLLNGLAGYRVGALAAYAQARPLYERALAISEKALGAEHPDTATSLNNLALLLKSQGDYDGARPLYERALAICEKVLGAEHPDTATSLNNLALLLKSQGDYDGFEIMARETGLEPATSGVTGRKFTKKAKR
jgi:tetratricopeptide (TPR) repeat protein